MEDLILYRYTIGIFAGIAYKNSSKHKVVKAPQKPKQSKKSQGTPIENNAKSKCFKYRKKQKSSRIAFLFLIISIITNNSANFPKEKELRFGSVTHNRNGSCNTERPQLISITAQHGVYNTHLTYRNKVANPLKLFHEVHELLNFKKLFFYVDLHFLSFHDNDNYANPTKMKSIDNVFLESDSHVNNKWTRNMMYLGSTLSIVDLSMTLMFMLGTCCYLLGNKGVHCYNGNPEIKSGDAILDERKLGHIESIMEKFQQIFPNPKEWHDMNVYHTCTDTWRDTYSIKAFDVVKEEIDDVYLKRMTLTIIHQYLEESVGQVSLKTVASDHTYKSKGTGFRVGDNYFITAYHGLGKKIDQMLSHMCFMLDTKELHNVFNRFAQELNDRVHINSEPTIQDVRDLFDKFVKETGTDIEKLFKILSTVADTAEIQKYLTDLWKTTQVEFIKHGRFLVDWKIVFGSEESDIVIVKLEKLTAWQKYPKPLLLEECFRQHDRNCIVWYINGPPKKIIIDQDTQLFDNKADLEKCVEVAIEWWKNKYPKEDESFFRDQYAPCKIPHDEETGRVILRASETFRHGSSGSPIMCMFKTDGNPAVDMIYQRGFPMFYHDSEFEGSQYRRFKDANPENEKCLFKGGTTMRQLSKLLEQKGRLTLQRNLFDQHDVEFNKDGNDIIRLMGIIEKANERIKEVKEEVQKDCERKEDVPFNFTVLNNEIETTRQILEHETSQVPFVATEAYERAKKILHEQNILFITGKPGDGKTTLAYQLVKYLTAEKKNLRPLILKNKDLFAKIVIPDNALCIIMDDVFGTRSVELSELSSVSSLLSELLILQSGNSMNTNILIMTSRMDVFQGCPSSIKDSTVFSVENMLDISLTEFMTKDVMRSLLQAYIRPGGESLNFTDTELEQIRNCSPNIGFPLYCKLASFSTDLVSLRSRNLINPQEFLLKELSKMERCLLQGEEGKLKYYCLIILLLYPTYFSLQDSDEKLKEIFSSISEIYSFSGEGKSELVSTLRDVEGLYVTYHQENSMYYFSHESVQTLVAYSFAANNAECFIQHCDPKYLSLLSCKQNKNYDIKVNQNAWPCLQRRICDLLRTQNEKSFKCVADMQVWNHEDFVSNALGMDKEHLLSPLHHDNMGHSMLVYFTKQSKITPVKGILHKTLIDEKSKLQINLAMNAACLIANEELVSIFLKLAPTPDIHYFINAVKGTNKRILSRLIEIFPTAIETERLTKKFYISHKRTTINVLHQACFEGDIDMLGIICQKFKEMALETSGLGQTVLHTASLRGHTTICEYLIDNFPKLLCKTYAGRSPLHEAARSGSIDCFNLIEYHVRSQQADMDQHIRNAVTDDGLTIFGAAVVSGNIKMCINILDKYAFLVHLTKSGHPLCFAAWSGSIDYFVKIMEIYTKDKDQKEKKKYVLDCLEIDGSSVLHSACKHGKSELSKYLINEYPILLTRRDNQGKHALHVIAPYSDVGLFEYVLNKSVDKDGSRSLSASGITNYGEQYLRNECLDYKGNTVLHIACSCGNTELCRYIAETFPNLVEITNRTGDHVLHSTIRSKSIECLNLMTSIIMKEQDQSYIKNYVSKCYNYSGFNILHVACITGDSKLCKHIDTKYPSLTTCRTTDGLHALHLAVVSGNIDCLETVIDIVVKKNKSTKRNDCILQCKDNLNRSILHFACSLGMTKMSEHIVNLYPSLTNDKMLGGINSLHASVISGDKDCFISMVNVMEINSQEKYLSQCKDGAGQTVLHWANATGNPIMCEYIAKSYPSLINVKTNRRLHCFHTAAKSGKKHCLKTMINMAVELQNIKDINTYLLECVDKEGFTILHWACILGKTAMCEYIVHSYPCLINVPSKQGLHCIHATAVSGNVSCMKKMIHIITEKLNIQHIEKYLLENVDGDGKTILHWACIYGRTEMCSFILDFYPCLNDRKTNKGMLHVHTAAVSGNVDCLTTMIDIAMKAQETKDVQKYLLACVDNEGKTILHWASRHGNTTMCIHVARSYPYLTDVTTGTGIHCLHTTAVSGNLNLLIIMIITVCEFKNTNDIKKLLLECLDSNGATILHLASGHGMTAICKSISSHFPYLIDVKTNTGMHCFHTSALSENVDCFIMLIDIVKQKTKDMKKYLLKCVDNERRTVLHIACSQGSQKMLEYIANTYPYLIDVTSKGGLNCIHCAVLSGNIDYLTKLINIVMKIKKIQNEKKFSLESVEGRIIVHGDSSHKKKLCNYIAKSYQYLINVHSDITLDCAHASRLSQNIALLKEHIVFLTMMINIILEKQNEQNIKEYLLKCVDDNGNTILHMACEEGRIEMSKYIAKSYPYLIDVKSKFGMNCVHASVVSGNTEFLTAMINIDMDNQNTHDIKQYLLECVDNEGFTILHFACRKGDIAMSKYIAKSYPYLLEVQSKDGYHCVHSAAISGNKDCMTMMINIDMNRKKTQDIKEYLLQCVDKESNTILHLACAYGKTAMCEYISNSYPYLLDVKGKGGLHFVHAAALSEDIDHLKKMINIDMKRLNTRDTKVYLLECVDNDGCTILHAACSGETTAMCKYIAESYPYLTDLDVKSKHGLHCIHVAAFLGNMDCLTILINVMEEYRNTKEKYLAACVDNEGYTILFMACRQGFTEMCKYIVDVYPYLIEIRSNEGFYCAHAAAMSGNINCLTTMINICMKKLNKQEIKEYLLQCVDNEGHTILHMACLKGNTAMCEYIANSYPYLTCVKAKEGLHFIHLATMSENIDCLKVVINVEMETLKIEDTRKYLLECVDNEGNTILHMACFNKSVAMCKYIAESHPYLTDLDVKSKKGCHCIHVAALRGSIDCLKILIHVMEKDLNTKHKEHYVAACVDDEGFTILHIACTQGWIEMCKYIVESYPYLIEIRSNTGLHCVHTAAMSGNTDCLTTMINIGMKIKNTQCIKEYLLQCTDENGCTILHVACRKGNTEMCQYIANSYPYLIDVKVKGGSHFVHAAALSEDIDHLKKMINIDMKRLNTRDIKRYLLECVDNEGNTILHAACSGETIAMCKYIAESHPYLTDLDVKSKKGVHCIHVAAARGNMDCLTILISVMEKYRNTLEKYLATCVDNKGYTILLQACRQGYTEMCKYIVELYPYLIEIRSKDGLNCVHTAAMSGNINCLTTMINICMKKLNKQEVKEYLLQCVDNEGHTILHMACLKGNTAMCEYIINSYPYLTGVKAEGGLHFIHLAAMSENTDCLKMMISIDMETLKIEDIRKYLLESLDNDGNTILHYACRYGNTTMCEYIVNSFPYLTDVKSKEGLHFIHTAALSEDIHRLKKMIDMDMNKLNTDDTKRYLLECVDNEGNTILHHACVSQAVAMCKYIAESHPYLTDLDVKSKKGVHCIHVAAARGNIDCLTILINVMEKYRNTQEKYLAACVDNKGCTILFMACRQGCTEMSKYIVKLYPYLIEIRSNNGFNCVHAAAMSGNTNCLKTMINICTKKLNKEEIKKYLLQCVDNVGGTILHMACGNGHTAMCEYIVNSYPYLTGVKAKGLHFIHLATMSENIDCLKVMITVDMETLKIEDTRKYLLECVDNEGSTILHAACSGETIAMCKYIAESHPYLTDLDVKSKKGLHCIHVAAARGNIDCLKILIHVMETDLNTKHKQQYLAACVDNEGFTILHIACRQGWIEMCKYIVESYPYLIKIRSNTGLHCVHTAAMSGNTDCLTTMINIGMKIKNTQCIKEYLLQCTDENGCTILHVASRIGNTTMFEYIANSYPYLLDVKVKGGSHFVHATALSEDIDHLKKMINIDMKRLNTRDIKRYLLESVDNEGNTILHAACSGETIAMCKYIAESHPYLTDLDVKSKKGLHCIHVAAARGNIDCLKILIHVMETDLNTKHKQQYLATCVDNEGFTILHIACRQGWIEMCKYIVESYPYLIKIRSNTGLHCVHTAAMSGNTDCLTTMINIGMKIKNTQCIKEYLLQCTDENGCTILHVASRIGNTTMFEYIANSYPYLLDVKVKGGSHFVHAAALSENIDHLKKMINIDMKRLNTRDIKRYVLECVDNDGCTILHAVCREGMIAMCKYIAESHPYLTGLDVKSKKGVHCIHVAAARGNLDCLKILIHIMEKDLHTKEKVHYLAVCVDDKGYTILHHACTKGWTEMCKYIVESYPYLIEIRSNTGLHCVHTAAMSGNLRCLKRLIRIVIEKQNISDMEWFLMHCVDRFDNTVLEVSKDKENIFKYLINKYPYLARKRLS